MKSFTDLVLSTFLLEQETHNSLLLLDIDGTLVHAKNIFIDKIFPDGKKEKISPENYAKENVKAEKAKGIKYGFDEFRDPEILAKSIKTGIPIVPNLQIMDSYIKNGWKIGILTARGFEDVIANTMKEWLHFKDEKGNLQNVGDKLIRNLVYAINDDNKHYKGEFDFDKKKNVISKLSKEYERIVFIDDDPKNINAIREWIKDTGIKNVIVKPAKAIPKK